MSCQSLLGRWLMVVLVLATIASVTPSAYAEEPPTPHAKADGLLVLESKDDVATSVARLKTALEAKGMTVFAVIDHAAGATQAGLKIPPTQLVIFGNPKAGTVLMQNAATMAIDLPMKMLIWKEAEGSVYVGYNAAAYLAQRHGLPKDHPVIVKITGALAAFAKVAAGQP